MLWMFLRLVGQRGCLELFPECGNPPPMRLCSHVKPSKSSALSLAFLVARKRVACDPVRSRLYFGVYVFGLQLLKSAVRLSSVDKVRKAVYGFWNLTLRVERSRCIPTQQHTLKPVYMSEKLLKSGQFKIVYASDGLVSPDSYSFLSCGLMVIPKTNWWTQW